VPPPIKVELLPPDPAWAERARAEGKALAGALGQVLVTVHHIGSTAIPGIRAKPVVDLMPAVTDLPELDRRRADLEALGYEWWGEYGLPGRRYCTKHDPATGRRIIQLHVYADGSPEIIRHLAFRDFLRKNPDLATAYEAEKLRCQSLHPNDSHAYSDCKNAWIKRIEAEALGAISPGDSPQNS
jgi:GrpB-like predicted nucleotidyltransferase (UPF0157 family)